MYSNFIATYSHKVFLMSFIWKGLVIGITLIKEELNIELLICLACMIGITRGPFPPSESGWTSQFLALIHSDLWGPTPVQTQSGFWYMISFTDDFSHYIWTFFLWQKSDAFITFKQWKAQVKKESRKSIWAFRTDNGSEYLSNIWTSYMKDEGIQWETTTTHTPEKNGVFKCLNCSIFNCVWTTLIDASLPLHFWAEVVNYIMYIKNCSSTCILSITPFEMCYKIKPDILCLHCFSCVAYILDDNPDWCKLNPKGKHALFIGYSETQKGWRVYHSEKKQIQVSAHIKFDDNHLTFTTALWLRGSTSSPTNHWNI